MKTSKKQGFGLQRTDGVGGHYEVQVMDVTSWNEDGTPKTWKPAGQKQGKKNLIIPAGVTFLGSRNWYINLAGYSWCHAGTGNTPNSELLDGLFSQSGTTVTRDSGTGEFISGNVNDFIKFGDGSRAKVISFTNALTVEVDRSQTVTSQTVTTYNTSRVTLDTFVASTASTDAGGASNGFTEDFDTGISTRFRTFNFATEASAKTYTEVGLSLSSGGAAQLWSRVVLDSPVNVDVGQFLQVKFTLRLTLGRFRTSEAVGVNVTGWPYPYTITDITSNGTYWDVTLDKAHHYVAGRPITISDAVPVKTNITSISSDPTTFTVTAVAHGRSAADSIVIDGSSVPGYDGTWTVASTPDADTLTVTSAINLGAATGGTVRLDTPGTWYNGTHTIASVPSASVVRITDANTIEQAGEGTMVNNLNAAAIISGRAFNVSLNFGSGTDGHRGACDCCAGAQVTFRVSLVAEANLITGMAFGVTANTTSLSPEASLSRTYSLADRTYTSVATFASDASNSTSIRMMRLFCNYGDWWVTFEERQRKDAGYQLQVTIVESWEPELI